MLKFVVCELLKSYAAKQKIPHSDYFVGIFAIGSFVTLLVADYFYLQSAYKPIGILLIYSTILFAIALALKITAYYLKKKSHDHAPVNFLMEAIPVITRILPASVIAFILWEIVKVKYSRKLKKNLKINLN